MTPPPTNDPPAGAKDFLRRWLPLAVLAAGLIAFFAFDLQQYANFQALARHRTHLLAWVDEYPAMAPLGFILAYALVVAFSLPVSVLFSLAAGFLFGAIMGTVYAVIAATIGATLIFLAARGAAGDSLARRAGPSLQQLEAGLRQNALSYLLFLRLVPVFPFWLVNLAAALVGMPLKTYVLGTLIGIIPGAFVFVNAGRGLAAIFDAGEEFSVESILTADLLIAFSLLGLLALVPIAYRKFKARGAG